jgi:hypothetical protein
MLDNKSVSDIGGCATDLGTHTLRQTVTIRREPMPSNHSERMDASIVNNFPFPGSPYRDPVHAEVLSSMKTDQPFLPLRKIEPAVERGVAGNAQRYNRRNMCQVVVIQLPNGFS